MSFQKESEKCAKRDDKVKNVQVGWVFCQFVFVGNLFVPNKFEAFFRGDSRGLSEIWLNDLRGLFIIKDGVIFQGNLHPKSKELHD